MSLIHRSRGTSHEMTIFAATVFLFSVINHNAQDIFQLLQTIQGQLSLSKDTLSLVSVIYCWLFLIHSFIVSVGNTCDSANNGVDYPSSSPPLLPDHLHILKSLLQNKLLHFLYSDKSNREERLLTMCHSTPPPYPPPC